MARIDRAPKVPKPHNDWFSRFALWASKTAGKPLSFAAACSLVVFWAISGPLFGFSEVWQLVINTFTTIVTFLMVFLIQNAQNRDTVAIQIKLAELILHMRGVPNELADAEYLTEDQLERVHEQYKKRIQELPQKQGKRKRKTRRR